MPRSRMAGAARLWHARRAATPHSWRPRRLAFGESDEGNYQSNQLHEILPDIVQTPTKKTIL